MKTYEACPQTDSYIKALRMFKDLQDHIYDIFTDKHGDSTDAAITEMEAVFGDVLASLEDKIKEQLAQSISEHMDTTTADVI